MGNQSNPRDAWDRRGERGGALVVALLLAFVLLLLGATFLSTSISEHRVSANEASSARAFDLAEAGLEHAVAELPDRDVDALLAAGGVLFDGQLLGGGNYTVEVHNNVGPDYPTGRVPADTGGAGDDTDGYLVLASTGRFATGARGIETVVRLDNFGLVFQRGIWAGTSLKISGGGSVDSYDSDAGPFDPLATGDDVEVFSNGDIDLSGGSMVYGDGTAGGIVKQPDQVTGAVTSGAAPETIAAVDCPAGPYTAGVPAGPGVSYDAVTGELTVSGGNDITLGAPPTSYYFSKVTLSGGSTLTLDSGGTHVDIFVAGAWTTSGGGVVNVSQKPGMLGLWACSGSVPKKDWVLSGGSGAYLTVHAPDRKVTLSGSGNIWGAIVGDDVESTGGSTVHYDTRLGGTKKYGRVSGTWTEVW